MSAGPGSVRVAICAAGEIWGGVEQFVVTLARGLTGSGIEPRVILFHDAALARRLTDTGVPVDVLRRRSKYDPRLVWQLRDVLRRHRINILHVHGYKATVLGALATRGAGVRLVKTEHGRLERPARWRDIGGYARMVANTRLDRLATRSVIDAVAFVSEDIERTASGGRAHPGRVIYNGIEPPPEKEGRPAWVRDGSFDVGIVGRIDRVKGHAHLLAALARLPHLENLRLHVFGTGPLEEACRHQCEQAGLTARVAFHGFQSPIEPHLRALDLLVMPSLHEGLPYALLEAMQLGVPVVASRVGGLAEALDGGCGVLVRPGNDTDLAAWIERMYGNARLREAVAERARRRVRDQFQACGMVRAYTALYADVLASAS
jgi:L-malate glycosyltransferase